MYGVTAVDKSNFSRWPPRIAGFEKGRAELSHAGQ